MTTHVCPRLSSRFEDSIPGVLDISPPGVVARVPRKATTHSALYCSVAACKGQMLELSKDEVANSMG